jgi:PhoH-like ATPase
MDEIFVTMVESGGNRLSKIYVLDTNVLLQDPLSIFSFKDNDVVIPAVVLEEVEWMKLAEMRDMFLSL